MCYVVADKVYTIKFVNKFIGDLFMIFVFLVWLLGQ